MVKCEDAGSLLAHYTTHAKGTADAFGEMFFWHQFAIVCVKGEEAGAL